jgi:hypothetical protein
MRTSAAVRPKLEAAFKCEALSAGLSLLDGAGAEFVLDDNSEAMIRTASGEMLPVDKTTLQRLGVPASLLSPDGVPGSGSRPSRGEISGAPTDVDDRTFFRMTARQRAEHIRRMAQAAKEGR